LTRRFDVNLHATARFLAIEPVVFGRQAMGERVSKVRLRDRWRIWRDGTLILADDLGFDGALPNSNAALAGNSAMATIIHIGDVTERQVDAIRSWIREAGAVSAWNGKLVARTLARDGFDLRKSVIPALDVLTGASGLPKVWSF
jgi:urease accessory protein